MPRFRVLQPRRTSHLRRSNWPASNVILRRASLIQKRVRKAEQGFNDNHVAAKPRRTLSSVDRETGRNKGRLGLLKSWSKYAESPLRYQQSENSLKLPGAMALRISAWYSQLDGVGFWYAECHIDVVSICQGRKHSVLSLLCL